MMIVNKLIEMSTQPLWDPWGVFFIYLTYEIEISDYKGMNLGWMNLGWMNLGWMNLGWMNLG